MINRKTDLKSDMMITLISFFNRDLIIKLRDNLKYKKIPQFYSFYEQICRNNENSINLIFVDKSFFQNFKILNNKKQKIFDFVLNLERLQALSLELTKYLNLTTLNLYLFNNDIDDLGLKYFSEKLSVLRSLTSMTLNFSRNKITENGSEFLFDGMSQLNRLRYLNLNLNFNRIGNQGLNKILFLRYNHLEYLELSLSFINIETEGVFFLSKFISQQTALKTLILDLSHNYFTDSAISSLINNLKKLEYLIYLDVNLSSNNKFGDKEVSILSESLGNLSGLNYLKLNLSYTNITDLATEYLSEVLYKLINLNSLHLYAFSNKVGKNCINCIYNSLIPLKKLNSVTLDINLEGSSTELIDKIRKLNKKTLTL